MKLRSFNLFVILALFLSLLGGALTFTPAYAAGIVVNTNSDNVVVDGLCTLREAIANANNNAATNPDCTAGAGADTITFAGDYTITLASQLPNVTSAITINGNGATKTIIQASTCNPVTLPGGCTPPPMACLKYELLEAILHLISSPYRMVVVVKAEEYSFKPVHSSQ